MSNKDMEEFLTIYELLPGDKKEMVYRLIDKMARIRQGCATKAEISSIQALREKYACGELTMDDITQCLSDIPVQ